MKQLVIVFGVVMSVNFNAFSISTDSHFENDSLQIFVIGAKKGEKFEIYMDGKLLLKFKGGRSYKYLISVPRKAEWLRRGQIVELDIYRKGRCGLKYKAVDFAVNYEPKKKYLILWRGPHLKNFYPFIGSWSDEEPTSPMGLHRSIR